VTFAEDLMALATDLKIVLRLFERETPARLESETYLELANRLYDEREKCEAEPTVQKGQNSVRETAVHMTKAMRGLAVMAKDLADLRGAYVPSEGSGNLGSMASDLRVMRKPHDAVTKGLERLVEEIENVAASLARTSGAVNSSQQANDKRPYRAVVSRMEGEYRRGFRRSG
jgi:hypothetical protein